MPVIEKATINAGSIDVNGIVKSMVKDREEKENNVVSIDDRIYQKLRQRYHFG